MIPHPAYDVLLIEENELDARMMQHRLAAYAEATFTAVRVLGLGAAIEAIAARRFDCALLDLSLPDERGLRSIEELHSIAEDLPIVVLTGLDDPETALGALERGAQDYVSKESASADIIGRAVRYAVARHATDVELRSAQAQLRLMHERERIARDLHDTVIQHLFATGMTVQSVAGQVRDHTQRARLLTAIDGIDEGIHQLRNAIFRLTNRGGRRPLTGEVAEVVRIERGAIDCGVELRLGTGIDDRVPDDVGAALLAALQEALSNVAKHAAATTVVVDVSIDGSAGGDRLVLTVADDGAGIDAAPGVGASVGGTGSPGRAPVGSDVDLGRPVGGVGRGGRGLANLAARAALLGGELSVVGEPGRGTTLTWAVPLSAPPR